MEDENRKARKGARREFNDNIRELASFVRKRDKRVSFFQVSAEMQDLPAQLLQPHPAPLHDHWCTIGMLFTHVHHSCSLHAVICQGHDRMQWTQARTCSGSLMAASVTY